MRIIFCAFVAASLLAIAAVPGEGMRNEQIRECYASSYRYEKTQNYEDAIKALLVVHQSFPQGYTINLHLGWLYYLKGNYANSEQHYLTAIKVLPGSVEAKLGYLLPLLARARHEQAETIAKQIAEVDPRNYYGNLRLAFALRMQAKCDQAEAVLQRMLTLYPADVGLLTEMGLVKVGQGEREASRRLFNEVLTLDPENVTAKTMLDAG